MPRVPRAKSAMTPFPHSVQWEAGVQAAIEMMEEHDIRHLPVTRDGALHGVVSDSDLRVARALKAENTDSGTGDKTDSPLQVGLICTRSPYVVDLEMPLMKLCDELVDQHISSALVTRGGRLCGIITTSDICRYLGDLLRKTHPAPPEDIVG